MSWLATLGLYFITRHWFGAVYLISGDVLAQVILCGGGRPVHFKLFSTSLVSACYMPVTCPHPQPPPPVMTDKTSPAILKSPLGPGQFLYENRQCCE